MHTFCAGLAMIPEGDWFCPECVTAREERPAAPAESSLRLVELSSEESSDAEAAAVAAGAAARRGRRRQPTQQANNIGQFDVPSAAAAAVGHPLDDMVEDVALSQRRPALTAAPTRSVLLQTT